MPLMEIGICSWSIDRHDPLRAIHVTNEQFGLNYIQLGFFTRETIDHVNANALSSAAQSHDVTITSTFAAFEREDYTSIDSIAQTGGYMPDAEYPQRLDVTCRVADISAALGSTYIATHIGTIPSETHLPNYDKLVERVGLVADELRKRGQTLLVETGRESAQVLHSFLDRVERDNLAINFDPGNFIVYGSDDPIRALATLRDRVKGVHMKDGFASANPGRTYGTPAGLGTGDARIPRMVNKLRMLPGAPPLLIECSGPLGTRTGIMEAANYLRSLVE